MRPPPTVTLESGLAEIVDILGDYTHEPQILAPEDARALRASCRLLFERARTLQRELDMLRLTRGAELSTRIEAAGAVAAAAKASPDVVVIFPGVRVGFDMGAPS